MERIFAFLIVIVSIFFLASCEKEKSSDNCISHPVSYEGDIAPLIQEYCTNGYCHAGELTKYEGLKRAVERGAIHNRVIEEKSMPPTDSPTNSPDISEEQRMMISCWIESGALNN